MCVKYNWLLKSQPSNVALQIQGPRLGQPNEDLGGHIYTVTNRLIIIDTDDEWMNEWAWFKWRCHSQTVAGALYNKE